MGVDNILLDIFQEARKMPGKDLRLNLDAVRRELDNRILDVINDLTRLKNASKDPEPFRRSGENVTQIKRP